MAELGLWPLIKHLRQWLGNLNRAGKERKQQSRDALRAVILAARSTAVYIRKLQKTDQQDFSEESKLSGVWTELGFRLSDLKLTKLAKRCDINGRYWSNPQQFDSGFLAKADIGLAKMEQLARQLLAEVEA